MTDRERAARTLQVVKSVGDESTRIDLLVELQRAARRDGWDRAKNAVTHALRTAEVEE